MRRNLCGLRQNILYLKTSVFVILLNFITSLVMKFLNNDNLFLM